MQSTATSIEQYLNELPPERRQAFTNLLSTIRKNIDPKFAESIQYGMLGWVIPKSIYPAGYHVDPTLPVSFIGIANQKHYLALYHMGIYADENLLSWFQDAYVKAGLRLDMGKSCIRFKRINEIPFELIGELVTKMSLDDYLALYTSHLPTTK
jgi:uncharacterized protein YdhG (YjbR/CyaY superfamily)